MDNIAGKVAFITGGASGIGLGIAQAFVDAGMRVVLADLREDHITDALAAFEITGQREHVHALRLDVTDRAAFARVVDEAERHFGKLHVLVNNAGMGLIGPIEKTTFADWDWGINVMLVGVINGLQLVLPKIRAHGEGGHIINTASQAALVPLPGTVIYSTVKSALVGMAESLRSELAKDGIGISAFCPGPVQSNIRETGAQRPAQYQDSGYIELEQQLAQRPNSPLWMSARECGERVLKGLRNNDLYILTHREFKEGAAERCAAIVAAYPDEPVNEARKREIAFLVRSPNYQSVNAGDWKHA